MKKIHKVVSVNLHGFQYRAILNLIIRLYPIDFKIVTTIYLPLSDFGAPPCRKGEKNTA